MKRILFVDDDRQILDGLRRALRKSRKVWDMRFAASGEEALGLLSDEPFDVVISDMRMPGLDGAGFLREVQKRSPRTARIVLSGFSDAEATLRSVFVSHQFLSKPCDANVLRDVVERACSLDLLLQDGAVRDVLGDVVDLPVLPRVYRSLVEALGEPDVGPEEVGNILGQDAGLTAKILQLVNSSYFGLRREIVDTVQAATYLGIQTIRDLVLSIEMFRQFEDTDLANELSLEAEQEHSLFTGRLASKLLDDKKASEQAFLAGMLHDIGLLVLASRLPDRLRRVLDAGGGRERPYDQVELEVLGVTHASIGAYLLSLWGMPYPVVEAVALHHRPSQVEATHELGVLGAVHVAQFLAHEVRAHPREAAPELDVAYLERCGVLGELPRWRAMAEEEAGGDAAAA